MRLEEFLARVFDRTQRVFPKSAHRTLLRWLAQEDEVSVSDTQYTRTFDYPAKWAASEEAYSEPTNTRWGAGQWGSG